MTSGNADSQKRYLAVDNFIMTNSALIKHYGIYNVNQAPLPPKYRIFGNVFITPLPTQSRFIVENLSNEDLEDLEEKLGMKNPHIVKERKRKN